MNDTIRTQLAHSSVRAFTNEPVTAELRTQILDAARAASTSCALQVTSIIRVTDPALRASENSYLRERCSQTREHPRFLFT